MGKSGDFTYASAAKRAAEEYSQDERSNTERAADKAKRAPVTTDYQRWKSDPAGLDFPGVDTPTGSPDVLPKDLKQGTKPDLSARAKNERPATPVERTTQDLEKRDLAEQDVSLGPGEAFDGTGAVGIYESDDQFGTTDKFGRYDKTPEEEAREIEQAAASMDRGESSDPFDMSDGGGALDSPTQDTGSSRQIEFGGQQVDLGQKDEEELKGMREMLNRNVDAEVDAQRMKGGTEPSSLAQDYADRAFEVDQELFDRGAK